MNSKISSKMQLVTSLAFLIIAGGNVKADFVFGTPTNLGPLVNSSAWDRGPSVTADGLELYFTSSGARGGSGGFDIWTSTRASTDDPWGPAMNLGPPLNSASHESAACISADGLELFFLPMDRPGGEGGDDVWVATRASRDDSWSEPVNLGSVVNGAANDRVSSISPDGLTLLIASDRPGGYGGWDLWATTRDTVLSPWGPPVNLGPTVNSASHEACASISADGLTLFFSGDSWDPGPSAYGYTASDLWVTRRSSVLEDWGTPECLLYPINSRDRDTSPFISTDGSVLFVTSDRTDITDRFGGLDLWKVEIIPIVDFNGDGTVDSTDMCTLIDHWEQAEPSCDVAPAPYGDGIVDVQDLVVLAEYLFTPLNDPTLVAHWALDETEGSVAHESIRGDDHDVMGSPFWQPTSGKVDGALELDGIDDCIITGSTHNPAQGPFSIFAWIKGGGPGQVIVSQRTGINYLRIDQDGTLITELGATGRIPPLQSQTVVTDEQWYRVGLVWDGSKRTLCVDDVVVAEDTLSNMGAFSDGINIGVNNVLAPGTFFSGLIDDIRIYNRAVRP